MIKNYKISGALGEITNKLDDKIQSSGGATIRENSFAELTNFIPNDTALVESLNGINLECLIKAGECKSFSVFLQGHETIIYIYEDKIISYIPVLQKLFLDIIPKKMLINTNAISSCIPDGQKRLFFNSTTGIYLATAIEKPENLKQGAPYFTIEIPEGLRGEEIDSVISDVYTVLAAEYKKTVLQTLYQIGSIKKTFFQYYGSKDASMDFLFDNVASIDDNLSGVFIKENNNLKLGDIVSVEIQISSIKKLKVQGKIIQSLKGREYTSEGRKKIYPQEKIPDHTLNALDFKYRWNIPSDAVVVNLIKLDIDIMSLIEKIFGKIKVNFLGKEYIEIKFDEPMKEIIPFITIGCSMDISSSTAYIGFNALSLGIFNQTIKIVSTSQKPIFNPYTPYILQGRLAVSTQATVKLSAVNNLTDFKKPAPENITEETPFDRLIQGISEITFISEWGEGQKSGFAIGSPEGLYLFSSIANIFSTTLTPADKIPCSYIPPFQIKVNGIPTFLVVQSDRKTITAVVFTFDKTGYENITDSIDFFDNDPIQKIVGFRYGKDNILFVLTDTGKLYGCLTGGQYLAWFRIALHYSIVDITTSEKLKKLFIVSKINDASTHNLVGSIDFNQAALKIKAEYFSNKLNDDYIFSDDIPKFQSKDFAVIKKNIPDDFKKQIVKPLIPKFSLHNQEIINKNVNTKAERRMRTVKNVAINVRDSNFFSVKFIYKKRDASFEKIVYSLERNNDNLDPVRIRELIRIIQPSPSSESVQLQLEGNKNSTVPLKIQSISYDLEYGNSR